MRILTGIIAVVCLTVCLTRLGQAATERATPAEEAAVAMLLLGRPLNIEGPFSGENLALAPWAAGPEKDLWVAVIVVDKDASVEVALLRRAEGSFSVLGRVEPASALEGTGAPMHGLSMRLDLTRWRISTTDATDVAFVVGVSGSWSARGRTENAKAHALYRWHGGKLTRVFSAVTRGTVDYEIAFSGTAQRGYFDLQLRNKASKEATTGFVWSGERYEPEAAAKRPGAAE